jgi:hypothetical protein
MRPLKSPGLSSASLHQLEGQTAERAEACREHENPNEIPEAV